ncbi:lipoate-protein ligase [Candidatus Termititenax persephonae]|uniref:Lipoate-protein ligase n=1 Tax=Candidatus Termititenax persephonae TaxID=2218525 RepID=A0A388TEC5_9BACT|nr:lipoate-protein ligase [Candidatus Termititenax persephonae]
MNISIEIDYPRGAAENMRRDETAFSWRENGILSGAYLRFYSWRAPAISLGYAQEPEKVFAVRKAQEQGVELTRRITGGGLVLHQPQELTYCLVAPLNFWPEGILLSCKAVSGIFIAALRKMKIRARLAANPGGGDDFARDICFLRPAKYEVVAGGRKLLGSAQKRGRFYLLQHGSLPLTPIWPGFAELLDIRHIRRNSTNMQSLTGQTYRYQDVAQIIAAEFQRAEFPPGG